MERIAEFDFFSLTFDEDGKPKAPRDLEQLSAHIRDTDATDVVLIAHGFRNDVADATGVYTRFLSSFREHLASPAFRGSLGARRFVVGGIYWPSKPFRETFATDQGGTRSLGGAETMRAEILARLDELKRNDATPKQRKNLDRAAALLPDVETSRAAQNKFVKLVLTLIPPEALDPTEGLDAIRAQQGSKVLERIGDDGARGIGDVFGSILGRIGQFLNLTTWYLMKQRSGVVGAAGVADSVRSIKKAHPDVKVHLVGHSLGGRLMAACAKALSADPMVQPDSLLLLEAAFSHFGFSPDDGKGTPGFFRDVVERNVVKGPFLSTFSAEDSVVGKVYAVASRLAGDRTRRLGDANDPFGGIGHNGTQLTTEAVVGKLLAPGGAYDFRPGVIVNLDGSGGLITDHGDVTNAAVTYAFASGVART